MPIPEQAIDAATVAVARRACNKTDAEYVAGLTAVANAVLEPEPDDVRLCVIAGLMSTYLMERPEAERVVHFRALVSVAHHLNKQAAERETHA